MTAACPHCGGPVGDCVVVPAHCRAKPAKPKRTTERRCVASDLVELVLVALEDHGPLTGNQIVGKVERRRKGVLDAVRELHRADRIVNTQEGRWNATTGANGQGVRATRKTADDAAGRRPGPVERHVRETAEDRNGRAGS